MWLKLAGEGKTLKEKRRQNDPNRIDAYGITYTNRLYRASALSVLLFIKEMQ